MLRTIAAACGDSPSNKDFSPFALCCSSNPGHDAYQRTHLASTACDTTDPRVAPLYRTSLKDSKGAYQTRGRVASQRAVNLICTARFSHLGRGLDGEAEPGRSSPKYGEFMGNTRRGGRRRRKARAPNGTGTGTGLRQFTLPCARRNEMNWKSLPTMELSYKPSLSVRKLLNVSIYTHNRPSDSGTRAQFLLFTIRSTLLSSPFFSRPSSSCLSPITDRSLGF